MGALNAGKIHKARRAANESPSRKNQFRCGLPTTGGDDARAVSDPFAPNEGIAHQRMALKALKFVEGRERRILVVEMDHKSDQTQPVPVMIQKRAAARAFGQRPTECMLNEAGRKHTVGDLPQFFETDSVLLRPAYRIETVTSDHLLRQRSSGTLREEDIFAEKLHPPCESRLRKTVAANAHIARRDADHLPFVAVQELGRCKPRVDLNTKRLGAGTEPTHNSA